ncbi:hypothetical protein SSX86_029459 [Deinandra increscens subsp. villosa]|uniref:F-box domain-containing protein n=1 Tax=Deinandra increscens subsp. villosa TaxID=3103831 RepID=A0AAP0GLT0_9ASTR
MSSRHGNMRMNAEGDRLSSLPDDVIHKILSFMDIREAIGTSGLSSRWRFIWTSLPYLNISTVPRFSKFVTNVLSHRNNLAEVYSVKLTFRIKVTNALFKRILNYALSHNIQQLNVVCLFSSDIEFPLSCFSSRSLKHLSLSIQPSRYYFHSLLTSTWELPALTTLDLHHVALCDDEADKGVGVFSKCANLQNLRLDTFKTEGSHGFSIIHPRLSNLTLENGSIRSVNIATPQLKNLTISSSPSEYAISAPGLSSFFYKGHCPLHLSTEGFHSLEKADICILHIDDKYVHGIICLLKQLHNVKHLTLSLEIIETLSSSVDLLFQQPSPFVNLKSLKICPGHAGWVRVQSPEKVTLMFTKLKSYLLDSSPGSIFTLVFHEEVKAQKIMAELGVILEEEKNNTKTNRAHLECGNAQVESHKPKAKMELKFVKMSQMMSSWENLGVQLQRRKEKAWVIFSKLHDIEELLTKLPASKRAVFQPRFSSFCAEADIAISKITECMKIQCDEIQSFSSARFHELATTLEPSS